MKVSQNPPPYQQAVEKAKTNPTSSGQGVKERGATSSTAATHASEVEISDNAKLMKQASEIAKSAPDVRADRVAALKKAVREGTYRVDAEAVADKLVDEHLASDLGKNNL